MDTNQQISGLNLRIEDKLIRNLTSKQEAFCQAIASGSSQSDAYRLAYNAQNMKQEAIHTKASELMRKGMLRDRVEQLRAPVVKQAQITLENHIAELQRLAKVAEDNGNVNAAIKAVELTGKVSGLYVEKIDHNVSGGVTVEIIWYGNGE